MARKPTVASVTKQLITEDKTTARILSMLQKKFGKGTDDPRTDEQLIKGIKYYATILLSEGAISEKTKLRHIDAPGRKLGSKNGEEGTPALSEAKAKAKKGAKPSNSKSVTKAPAKKVPAKKVAAKKAPAEKSAKAPVKKAVAKVKPKVTPKAKPKSGSKASPKATAKKAPAKKVATKRPVRKSAKKA